MQYRAETYNQQDHDCYKALALQQPHASNIADGSHSIAFVDYKVKHKGEILICSTHQPEVYGLECGATLALAKLVDVKHTSKFTEADWIEAGIEREARDQYKHFYGLFISDVEKVIEMPFSGSVGLYEAVYTKGEIMKYPTVLHVDMKGIKETIKYEKSRV